MAGRGFLTDVSPIYDERLHMLRNGQWQMMTEPINYDRPVAGVSLAASFAAAYVHANPNDKIGLIPCAEGGSTLDQWHPDGTLFQHAIAQARFAMKTSTIAGILWHQGESDSMNNLHETYYDKLHVIIEALRHELQLQEVPLIIGELGHFLGKTGFGLYSPQFEQVNAQLRRFAHEQPHCYFVTAQGLTANLDGIHLDAASQRKFGYRYFEAFATKQHVLEPLPNEADALNVKTDYSKTEQIYMYTMDFALGNMTHDEFQAKMAKVMQS
ncbi:acetylxylan esterase [Caryophanon latum]|uniref:Acetylxylan esterase n=2 Tax=Caryophanon latum TaxID=33977 RepID=A0A1C0YJQ7_9BACL|nr:acetylxylan esterase [Caryophanon latum]